MCAGHHNPQICEKGNLFALKKVRKRAKIRNQKNQIPHRTKGTIWKSDKNTRRCNKQESHEVSPFPTGDHKAAMNRQDSMTDCHKTKITKRIHKRSTTLVRSVRKLPEGLTHLMVPTSPLFLMWIKTHICLVIMNDLSCNSSLLVQIEI